MESSFLQDNVVQAAGELGERDGPIPMGGPFSAQSADLHRVWSCKKTFSPFHRLGEVTVTNLGTLQWLLVTGNVVAVQQFRDNVMVATKGRAPHETMYQVCLTSDAIWDLRVLCTTRTLTRDVMGHAWGLRCDVRGRPCTLQPPLLLPAHIPMC